MTRLPRDEVIRARVTKVTKREVLAVAAAESRTESEAVRLLVEEALAARAARPTARR